jgi:hypothetical protein
MAIVTFYSPFAKGNKKTWEAKAQLKVVFKLGKCVQTFSLVWSTVLYWQEILSLKVRFSISLLINTPLDIALPKWQIW